ncbi:chromosome segregation protein SMC [Lachnospiraceae bacterium LCP25S3_G4]
MYLKSIEVQGFKSFANKIVFDFHNGITGIVGPNGSGKSNVADAVRWVLGEQRVKQLRGGSMQDVIFSGTENRKPLSYASVAITLDNSDHQLAIDFEEVTVTRKIYRSGESEYLINGSSCRLKDVNELFYDTGIGKEGYSIIGQGQIDKILSGKPEERRELFDEAAGIVKFKRRKNMSVKKLEDERQNLVRVNDILSEIERQIGPLEKQSTVAKEYLKKKEELKTYDINMFLLETERLKELINDTDKKLELANHDLAISSQSYDDTKVEYEAIEEQVDVIEDAIEKSKSQLNETNLLKQQLESQIELLKEQINTARMNDEHYGQRLLSIQSDIREREKQKAELEAEHHEIQQQLDESKGNAKAAKDNLAITQSKISKITAAIEQGKNDIIDLLNTRSSTKVKIQRYDTMLEQIQVQRAQVSKKLIEVKSDASQQEDLYHQYEVELKNISEKINYFVEKSSKLEARIEVIQGQLTKQNEQLRIGQIAFHREQSKLESLKNITERYDGYGNSIRKVMEKKEQEPGLLGVVADIIKVEKEYEIAIETALGGSIQNIVTDNEHTAKRMIQYLKQNKFGRATFLPLTGIHGTAGIRQQDALKEQGVIGLANTLVQVDDTYKILADHLLGRTIVVHRIDDGIAIAKKYKQSLRIVTTEGELINPGGSMTGGAFKNSSNLLGRRREIEEFEKSVLLLKTDMETMQAEVEDAKKERTACYGSIEAIKYELQQAYVLQNTAKMNINQVQAKQLSSKQSFENLQSESRELEQQIIDIRESQSTIQKELDTSQEQEESLTGCVEEYQADLEKERLIETHQMQESEKLHVILANLVQKNDFAIENRNRVNEEISKLELELDELDKNKGNSSNEILEKEEQISEIRNTIASSKELFDEIDNEIKQSVVKREELQQQHKAFLSKREELAKTMSDLDKEVFRLSSKRESYEESAEKQINYMWEEYELTYSHALELRDKNLIDLNFMKRQIQALKLDIKNLGTVNVNAIDDYKNLSERYEFLKTQHDDLIEAEATLMQIIEELDEAMRIQFRESFDEISKEFDTVFKQLFGGGKGTLELMDNTDILEAGIRIIAQPPGKKLQNMMQLSGGEKALTAISLLFAIQNLKPSPFCLLDEIEAALDDSNVVRFAQYLHKLTKNTQFIVITHRRGTMTAADRLYGITMQEKGISTLVSVNLLEDELDK